MDSGFRRNDGLCSTFGIRFGSMKRADVEPLLSVSGLRAGYGRGEVLHGVDLVVGPREIVAIVGPNGAGKTTLMAAVMGLLPRTGEIRFRSAPAPARTEALVAAGLVLVPETRALFPDMTVADNLELGAFQRYRAGERGFTADFARVFDLFPRLAERRAQRAGTLSGGERQMLALGRALMARPTLLLLDEPSLGLAPRIVRDIFHVLGELRGDGLAILLVEQNARAALQLSDYGYVLEMGEVVLEGRCVELADHQRVRETYLGSQREGHAVG
jgi:branched-chain amino acid transport system ATP-binding protein